MKWVIKKKISADEMTFQCLSSYPTVTVINYMLLARKRTGLSAWWYEPILITQCYIDHLNYVIYQLGLQRSRDDAIFVFISKSVMTQMRMLMSCFKIFQRKEMRASYFEISPYLRLCKKRFEWIFQLNPAPTTTGSPWIFLDLCINDYYISQQFRNKMLLRNLKYLLLNLKIYLS